MSIAQPANDSTRRSAVVGAGTNPEGALLQLPYDRLKTPQTELRIESIGSRSLSIGPGRELNAGVESHVLLIACCAELLYRYTGQRWIPLVIRTGNAGATARTIEIEASGAYSHSEMLLKTLEALESGAEAGGPRVAAPFAVTVLDQLSEDPAVRMMTDYEAGQQPEVSMRFGVAANEISLQIEYDAALFDRDTIDRLTDHFEHVLRSAVEDPSHRVADTRLFSRVEQEWFRDHCDGQVVDYWQVPIHEEFEACAERNPDKVAVRFNDESLTYGRLNADANRLANYLRKQGIGIEDRVVVCIDPCLDVATVLLAILKSGATYVPVNPDHPEYRIASMVADTDPELIITQSQIAETTESFECPRLFIDEAMQSLEGLSAGNLDLDISLDQTAYIYYTSGTTGKPKGIMASYANQVNSIHVTRDRFGITDKEVMPVVASYTFSISMFELMSALSVGGTIEILERAHVLDVARMAETMKRVTMFHIGPSLLKNIVRHIKDSGEDYSAYEGVRHASSGGDMVPPELLTDLRRIFSSAEVFVFYGCSEITLTGCAWRVFDSTVEKTYVGSPFNNVRLRVLDSDMNAVPIGAVGDVYFGGPGIVKGYLNRPELENELFIEREGLRFYTTGDRGRLNADGNLELLGRRDFQIQLRGMRIELAEIDYHLRQADGVQDGIVAAKTRKDGEKVLVGYYVSVPGNNVDIHALRDHMFQRLPDYMVPTFFMELDALPLNPNMKVDRKALPDYESPADASSIAPRTDTEKALAKIWCDLLHFETVGVEDNFMMLGGDSLLAVQLMLTVERELGAQIEGMEILRESLAVLAQTIDRRTGKGDAEDVADGHTIKNPILPVEAYYFGPDDRLFGLYQHAVGERTDVPVLMCPSIGYVFARCQFLLQLLSENLARAGVPSLQFHFYGSGDSLGDDVDARFALWGEDLRHAVDELKRRSGADKVRVLAFRLTSLLALEALAKEDVERWVLWDPVADGADYYRALRRMNGEKADRLMLFRNLRKPNPISDAEELAGATFHREAVDEMKALRVEREAVLNGARISQVLSSNFEDRDWRELVSAESASRMETYTVDDACNWYDSTMLNSAITHHSILQTVERELTRESS